MTAPTQTAGPGPRTAFTAPVANPQPTDVTRVLVVGLRNHQAVRWALTQVWRRVGRPLLVTYGPGLCGIRALQWSREHAACGIEHHAVRPGDSLDVMLTFGPRTAAIRAALPLARRAGIEVVDGDTVEEFA